MDSRKDDATAGKGAPARSATATAQLKAEVERQTNAGYGDSGTPNSVARNLATGSKQRGPSQG